MSCDISSIVEREARDCRIFRWQLQLLTQRRVLRPQCSPICVQAGEPRRQHLHLPVQRGLIGLQNHSKGLRVQFRHVRIKEGMPQF
jgi:hypothetical protein